MTDGRAEALVVAGITYSYSGTVAIRDVSFELDGGVVGLLGPNGAGKSTLLNLVSTAILDPQAGAIFVDGYDASDIEGREKARRSLGYLPQRFDLISWGTCRRNVEYAAWAHGVEPTLCASAAAAALRVVDLDGLSDARVRTLSGGQRQRLGIACAIAHEPRVLILDEPTVGLDPEQRADLRDHLRRLGERCTVLVSSHIVEDLERIASRIIVLAKGRMIFDGDLRALRTRGAQIGGGQTLEDAYISLVRHAQDADRP